MWIKTLFETKLFIKVLTPGRHMIFKKNPTFPAFQTVKKSLSVLLLIPQVCEYFHVFFLVYVPRQERRSKIYSFGLGKRQSTDLQEDDYEFPAAASANSDKRSSQRQFSFGLGKRDTEASDHVKSTS